MTKPATLIGWVDLVVRTCTAVAGLVLLAAAAVHLFGSNPTLNTAGLITGAILLPLPLVIDRLAHFSVEPTGLKFRFTQQVAELGAPKSAGLLEESGLAGDLEAYAFIYTELTDPSLLDTRKKLLDRLVSKATALAVSRKFDAGEVQDLFAAGSPVMRVLALGLMEGDPSLVSAEVLREGLIESQTGNEQYHALKLAESNWCRLSEPDREVLRDLIKVAPYIKEDPDRRVLADKIANRDCGPGAA